MDGGTDRRAFLRLGGLLAAGSAAGCATSRSGVPQSVRGREATAAESAQVWKARAGSPYLMGDIAMPGVCTLPGPNRKTRFPDPEKYKDAEQVPGMCQLCSTVCGIIGHVKDGRVIKVDGNPNDPNTRGRLCARGQASLNHQYHAERLLYPIRRVGPRGEGKWRRITWDEAYDELAERLNACRESDPTQFAFHQGRSRTKDPISAFLNAFGTATQLNHRGLCSAARRAANLTYLFESDWDLGNYENSKYILNFGSNMFEAHQGHVAGAQRVQRGRFENGAKLVTFDVRMSNTAGNSDEFFMPSPGSDGAIGVSNGMSEMPSAKEAPVSARTSESFSWSAESTKAMTCVSKRQEDGKSGRSGRSMQREVSVSFSLGRPSRRKNPPGILPAE